MRIKIDYLPDVPQKHSVRTSQDYVPPSLHPIYNLRQIFITSCPGDEKTDSVKVIIKPESLDETQ